MTRLLTIVATLALAVAALIHFMGRGNDIEDGDVVPRREGHSDRSVEHGAPEVISVPVDSGRAASPTAGLSSDLQSSESSEIDDPEAFAPTSPKTENETLLAYIDSKLAKAGKANSTTEHRHLMSALKLSIASVMDQFDRAEPQGRHEMEDLNGQPLQFILNGRAYYFQVEEFPEYGVLGETIKARRPLEPLDRDLVMARIEEGREYLSVRVEEGGR